MKKEYIIPSIEVMEITPTAILAQSIGVNGDDSDAVDTSNPGIQRSREDNPSMPNLWDQVW